MRGSNDIDQPVHEAKPSTVEYDGPALDAAAIVAAIEGAGFEASAR